MKVFLKKHLGEYFRFLMRKSNNFSVQIKHLLYIPRQLVIKSCLLLVNDTLADIIEINLVNGLNFKL